MKVRVFLVVCAILASVPAGTLDLTTADIERALQIARGRDQDRARFHAPYISTLNKPFVQTVEVITEFRRVVLIGEEHIARGDRRFTFSAKLAQEAVSAWKNRVAFVARMQFHPQNTYVNIPDVGMKLDGPSGAAAFIGIKKDAVPALAPTVLLPPAPSPGQPILGAVVEAVFDAALIGRTTRTLTVTLDGREVATTVINLGSLQ